MPVDLSASLMCQRWQKYHPEELVYSASFWDLVHLMRWMHSVRIYMIPAYREQRPVVWKFLRKRVNWKEIRKMGHIKYTAEMPVDSRVL